MSWSQAELSSENLTDANENSQVSDSSVEDLEVMNNDVLDDSLQQSARTDRAEIVRTAEVIMHKVSVDPDKNQPVRIGKKKNKTKKEKKKKTALRNVWQARRNFLEGNYASVQEDSDIAGALCNLSL